MIYRLLTLAALISGPFSSGQTAWKTFSREELTSHVITVTLADRSGNLWLGTSDGLCIYNQGSWVPVSRVEDMQDRTFEEIGHVLKIWEDDAGNIWLASKGRFFAFNGKYWVNYRESLMPDYNVRFMLHDSRDDIWLCSEYVKSDKSDNIRSVPVIEGTVTRFNGLAWINYEFEAGGSDYVQRGDEMEFYTGLLEDQRGYIWIGSVAGLRVFTGAQWLIIGSETLPGEYVTDLLMAGNGDIWISTTGGISRFDGTSWDSFRQKDGLGGNYIRRISEDPEGRIWAFISGNMTLKGLSCFEDGKWTSYNTGKELPSGNIISSFGDFCNSGMVMTRSGAAKFNGREWEIAGRENGLHGEHFYSLAADSAGMVWICSDHGLFTGDGKTFETLYKPRSGRWEVTAMLHDSRGRTWVATSDHMVFLTDNGKVDQFAVPDGLPDESVDGFIEDKSGRIWAIYRKEVALYKF